MQIQGSNTIVSSTHTRGILPARFGSAEIIRPQGYYNVQFRGTANESQSPIGRFFSWLMDRIAEFFKNLLKSMLPQLFEDEEQAPANPPRQPIQQTRPENGERPEASRESGLENRTDNSKTIDTTRKEPPAKVEKPEIIKKKEPPTPITSANKDAFPADRLLKEGFEKTAAAQVFTTADGTRKQVPMLVKTGAFRYYDFGFDGFEAVKIPFDNNKRSLVLILPRENISLPDFYNKITVKKWDKWMSELNDIFLTHGRVILPQLSDEATDAGTKGARKRSQTKNMLQEEDLGVTMNIDRPFLFAIQDEESKKPVFYGAVTDPTQ